MFNQVDPEQLKRISLFDGASHNQIEAVAEVMRVKHFKANDVIIREGELGCELYLLLSGSIAISKKLTMLGGESDTIDKSLVQLKDTDHVFFGEMALLGSEERSATVRALTEVKLGMLTRAQVKRLSEKDPELGYRIFYNIGITLADNLRRSNRDILKLATALCLALDGG